MMSLETSQIAALYERYGAMVLRRCRRLLRDEAQAEDAAQDVFVQFLRNRDRLTAEYPSSLLFRIATNHCLTLIRDSRNRGRLEEGWLYDVASWEDPAPRLEARGLLDKIFGRHEESTRTMAVLHLLDGMTLEEVAAEVDMSVSGVRRRLRVLKESLAGILGESRLPGGSAGISMEAP
jgi:RNA polymerase sigma-70 factor (ECF subfamily)